MVNGQIQLGALKSPMENFLTVDLSVGFFYGGKSDRRRIACLLRVRVRQARHAPNFSDNPGIVQWKNINISESEGATWDIEDVRFDSSSPEPFYKDNSLSVTIKKPFQSEHEINHAKKVNCCTGWNHENLLKM